jgi:hypothetical protein
MEENPPPAGSSPDVKFEIGHVLFIDIVGYSKLLINEQSEQQTILCFGTETAQHGVIAYDSSRTLSVIPSC